MLYKALVIFLSISYFFINAQGDQEITITVDPGTEECFYETFTPGGAFELDYQVIDGGQGELDISFYLSGPDNKPLIMDYKKPENSHRIELKETGAYRLCFDNRFSSFNRKTVFFALYSEKDENSIEDISTYQEEQYDMTVAEIENSMHRVRNFMAQIRHLQEQIRAFEARDRNVAESNNSLVNNWSILQIVVMLAVGVVQVIMVKSLFDEQSKVNKFLKSSKLKW